MGWGVLTSCLSALWNWNTSTATSSLTARMHRWLQSGLHTHLQVRLLPDGLRFCEIFCSPHFVIIKTGDVQGWKECYCDAGKSHLGWRANQRPTRCSALLKGLETKWITLPEINEDSFLKILESFSQITSHDSHSSLYTFLSAKMILSSLKEHSKTCQLLTNIGKTTLKPMSQIVAPLELVTFSYHLQRVQACILCVEAQSSSNWEITPQTT